MNLPIHAEELSESQIGNPVLVTVEEAAACAHWSYDGVRTRHVRQASVGQGRATASRSPRWRW